MAGDVIVLAAKELKTLARLFGELPGLARRMFAEQATAARFAREPASNWWLVPGLNGRFRLSLRDDEGTDTSSKPPVYDIEVHVAAVIGEVGTDDPTPVPIRALVPFRVRVPNLIRVGPGDQVALDLTPSGLGTIRFENVSSREVRIFSDGKPIVGLWPAAPVLAFAREVRKWIANPAGHSRELVGLLPRAQDPDELRRVLAVILDGFLDINKAMTPREEVSVPIPSARSLPWEEFLSEPAFELEEFRATVDLRLGENGKLAHKDRDNTVQVQMELEMVLDQGRWVARAGCRPPDFLLDGELAKTVRAAFAADRGFLKDLSKAIGRTDVGTEDLERFIKQAPEASVMRVGRDGDEDTELLIVEGTLGGIPTAVLAVAEVEFKKGDRSSVEDLDDVRLLYPDAKTEPGLSTRDQKWLLQVIRAARMWGGFGFLDAREGESVSLP